MLTLDELRKNGWKISVYHLRNCQDVADYLQQVNANHKSKININKKAVTRVIVSKNNLTCESEAICSNKDQFNKKLGLKIALGRLEKKLSNLKY